MRAAALAARAFELRELAISALELREIAISALELREIAISALELREIAISVLELREIEPSDRRRLELGHVAEAQPGVRNELDARVRHGVCVRSDGTQRQKRMQMETLTGWVVLRVEADEIASGRPARCDLGGGR